MINILIVDDHQIFIDGLMEILKPEQTINIIGQALNAEQAETTILEGNIDVVLLDINLPDKNGFEICKAIKAHDSSIKIIALTMHGEGGYISKMAKLGVDGYVLKNAGRNELLSAIQKVYEGQKHFGEEVTQLLLTNLHEPKKIKSTDFIQKLTRREKEILQLIVDELTTDEIAEKLFISSTTVISHRKSLLRKLNAKNTAGIVKAAYEFGLLN